MPAATLIIIIAAIIYSLALQHLIAGVVANSTLFGLPDSNFVSIFIAIVFVVLSALMVAGPIAVVATNKRKGKRK